MNIQQLIIKGIHDLLYKHDYLVIPDFGGFVLKSHTSQFSASGTSLYPPSKKLGFNVQLRQNDSVLISWLQKELGCELHTAKKHIDEFSSFCSSLLQSKRRLNIEQIGFFYLDFENNICFEPRQDTNFLSDSFGLGPVSVSELVSEEIKSKTPVQERFIDRSPTYPESKPEIRPVPQKSKRTKIAVLTGLAVFMLLGLLSLVLNIAGPEGLLKSSFVSHSKKQLYRPLPYPALELIHSEVPNLPVVTNSQRLTKIELEPGILLNVKAKTETVAQKGIRENSGLFSNKSASSYEIIFGCFAVKNNAIHFARKLEQRNLNVRITPMADKQLFAVSIGSYKSKEEAKGDLQNIKSEFPSVWIKKLP